MDTQTHASMHEHSAPARSDGYGGFAWSAKKSKETIVPWFSVCGGCWFCVLFCACRVVFRAVHKTMFKVNTECNRMRLKSHTLVAEGRCCVRLMLQFIGMVLTDWAESEKNWVNTSD